MTAKDYLLQYSRITNDLKQLQSEIDTIMASAESAATIGDGTPHGSGTSDKVAQLAVRLADLRTDYERKIVELWGKRAEIVDTIRSVPDPLHSQLLYDRYVMLMRWDEVAKDIHADESYTRGRLHGTALLQVDVILSGK